MELNRTVRLIAFALLIFLLLPCGCGEDDKGDPPVDAFDGVEYTPGPTFLITSGGGEDFTTNQATLTLEGITDMTATAVMVGDLGATLTDNEWEYAQVWSIDLDLNEGENAFTVNAQDDEGNEGLEKTVTITYDPDYVPDPPENTAVAYLVVVMIVNKCYDPAGSRPSEIRGEVTYWGTDDGTNFKKFFRESVSADTQIGAEAAILGVISAPVFIHGYKVKISLYEEDDGFWTGDNDPVGSGEILIGINEDQATTTIDSNEIKVLLGVTNY